ncbi:MAG: DUF4173 domain-containing protein [Longimicrobiales bacterium]|nr:DUF4173 domain-containing protein [Longimicrobiales bacterium]
MSEQRGTMAAALLGAGLLLGIAADQLLWLGPLGPGMTLWMALLGSAAVLLTGRAGWPWHRDVIVWSAVAVLAVAGTMWRASPVLNLLFLATAVAAASCALLAARGKRLGETAVLDHVWGFVLAPWFAVTGSVSLLTRARLPGRWASDRAAGVGRGVLLGIPPVLVFGALFASADPAFGRVVDGLVPNVAELPEHVAVAGFFAWVAAGLLAGLLPGRSENPLAVARPPRLGVEVTTVLGLVAVVFTAFIAVQFSYLFGGTAAIEGATGLTVAEYARRGFFELLAVAGLVTVLLLVADAASPEDAGRRGFRLLAGLLVGLVMLVIASAGLRLGLYIDQFGLTTARLYAAAAMTWIAITLVLFGVTVLRDRPRRFASGALLAGLAMVAALTLLNPDAAVARTNLARATAAAEDPAVQPMLDAGYLAHLSADAVPVVLPAVLFDRAHRLMGDMERCGLAAGLIKRWAPASLGPEDRDWRRWNAAEAGARVQVEGALPELREIAADC